MTDVALQRHTTTPLPQWLKALRAHTEQTQAQFAEVVGVHRITLVAWEAGRAYPDIDNRIRLNDIARDAGFAPIPPKLRRRR
jgi:DNA-binding XRE family transcriptional regulator